MFTPKQTAPEIDEGVLDLSQYEQLQNVKVSNNVMEQIVLSVNKRIKEITGLCTYIIDTHEVRKYKHGETGDEVYRCRFMVLKHRDGFPFAFAVSSDVRIMNDPESVNWNDLNMQATLRTLGVSQGDLDKTLKNVPIEFVDEKTGEIDVTKVIIAKYMKEVSDSKPLVVVVSLRTQPLDTQKPTSDTVFTTDKEIREFEDFDKIRENHINFIKNTPLVEKKIRTPDEMYGRPKIAENISLE
tara:strand:+ start:936 stop:1658 length:723 start_codon:yes stop_codon:yes gene_type:complete